ncbi:MAG: LysR family transcriptional regulator [Pseudomonadota bacterium]
MNWNDARVFLAIAETGSLAGAAKRLGKNHSTVFRRLNALEASLNTRLFERQSSGYVTTPIGDRLLELSRDVEGMFQQIDREVAGRDLEPTGLVRLTTAPNIARTLMPSVVRGLQASHPGIVLEIAVGDGDYNLSRREADIALRATRSPPLHLVGRKILDLSWWVCGASRSRRQTPLNLDALTNHALVGADAALMRLEAFQWLERHYADQIVARANDLSTMAAMTVAGVGLSILPSDQREMSLKHLLRIPNLDGELWLLTHPDLRRVARIRAVWDAVLRSAHVLSTS